MSGSTLLSSKRIKHYSNMHYTLELASSPGPLVCGEGPVNHCMHVPIV